MPRLALLPCACMLALIAWAAPAAAQVRRCVDAQGNSVFTDRACSTMQATPKAPPVAHSGAYARGFARRGCARSPEALMAGVRGALEVKDVNRLATFYHWSGVGSGAAKYLMDQLEGIAARPLVAVALVYPESVLAVAADMSAQGPAPAVAPSATPDSLEAARAAAPPPPEPTALRVDQMRGSADPASARLEFGLRQNAGCWWIEL